MSINCIIDSSIRLNPNDLPKDVLDEIFNHLRIPNPQKITAEREMLWGAKNLPDYIELWKYNGHNELILPRGFYRSLFDIFEENHIEVSWSDRTVCCSSYHSNVELIPLRDYQSKAIEELAQHRQGIYSAPTGAGKTRVMLELIRTLKQKTLVICEKSDISQQWIDISDEFGFDVGWISGGNFDDDKDLIIALRQSIIFKELDQDWFDQFGSVVYDETHHAQAPTAFDLIQKFPARYRFGCSATPDSDQDLFPIISAVIGPVVHESTPEEIGEHLVIPSVRVVKTDFEFPYRPTVRAGSKVVRNNYGEMMKSLEEDWKRNNIIVSQSVYQARFGSCVLVYSSRKKHLEILLKESETYCEFPPNSEIGIYLLTGDNSLEYSKIKEEIENSDKGSILFSTLANEGTDIPRLDRIFLAYPGRKVRGFEQAIGRIMRPHPKKKDAIVYDFRDANVSILNSQYRFRAQNIYNKKNYKIEHINA